MPSTSGRSSNSLATGTMHVDGIEAVAHRVVPPAPACVVLDRHAFFPADRIGLPDAAFAGREVDGQAFQPRKAPQERVDAHQHLPTLDLGFGSTLTRTAVNAWDVDRILPAILEEVAHRLFSPSQISWTQHARGERLVVCLIELVIVQGSQVIAAQPGAERCWLEILISDALVACQRDGVSIARTIHQHSSSDLVKALLPAQSQAPLVVGPHHFS